MQLIVTKVLLYRQFFTVSYITEQDYRLIEKSQNKLADQEELTGSENVTLHYYKFRKNGLKVLANAMFLKPFVSECINSKVYRINVITHLHKLNGTPSNGIVFLKLMLEPPDKEIIDYLWNDRMLRLVWTRVEIENAFSWLSTLGGAYSALGDYFDHCAEEAGRISVRQYKLSKMLGDESLAARSKLYSALSHAQKGNLGLSRHIVRHMAEFARCTQDKRLYRMCQGVWAKLKYLRLLSNSSKQINKCNINVKNEMGDV